MAGPIFVLGCTPRCGSTWIQRVITAHGVLIWGEHYRIYRKILDFAHWSRAEKNDWNLDHFRTHGPASWMAVLMPEYSYARAGLLAFMKASFVVAAKEEGYDRWGCKEVVWDENLIGFLAQAWPTARFVFLHRGFYSAFSSRFSESYSVPKKMPILRGCDFIPRDEDVHQFCQIYIEQTRLALKFSTLARYKFFRYEQLVDDAATLSDLLQFCKINPMEDSELDDLIGGKIGASKHTPMDPADEKIIGFYLPHILSLEDEIQGLYSEA